MPILGNVGSLVNGAGASAGGQGGAVPQGWGSQPSGGQGQQFNAYQGNRGAWGGGGGYMPYGPATAFNAGSAVQGQGYQGGPTGPQGNGVMQSGPPGAGMLTGNPLAQMNPNAYNTPGYQGGGFNPYMAPFSAGSSPTGLVGSQLLTQSPGVQSQAYQQGGPTGPQGNGVMQAGPPGAGMQTNLRQGYMTPGASAQLNAQLVR